jgi:hypothetical protein
VKKYSQLPVPPEDALKSATKMEEPMAEEKSLEKSAVACPAPSEIGRSLEKIPGSPIRERVSEHLAETANKNVPQENTRSRENLAGAEHLENTIDACPNPSKFGRREVVEIDEAFESA